jgi:hypothetical protein
MTSDFDYKKYSLGQLETWVTDALTSAEASPQEIYDTIKRVVEEEYYHFKHHTERCYELLALLNGNGNSILKEMKDDCMPPWGHSDMEALRYTEEELNSMCDKAASDEEKNKCREYNLREAEYYNKRVELDAKQDKVVKWQLPIEIDGASGEYYIQFPDDLMEAANIKENDMVEWVDQDDGSYLLKKVEKRTEKVSPNNMTWDQAMEGGWSMTDDGFWIKK